MHKKILSLSLAAVLLLGLTACGEQAQPADPVESETVGVAVQVQQIYQDTIYTQNKVTGQVSSDNAETIMVAQAAKCTAVYFEAGDLVKAGDVICTLDMGSTLASYNAANISYQAALQSYQDQKAILDRQLALAETNVANTKALFEIGAASQLEVDNAEISYLSAKAQADSALAQMEAGIQNAKSGVEQLASVMENVDSRGNIIAPISGTLTSLNAVENSYVSNTMPVAVIDGGNQMKIIAMVSETLVPKLAAGTEVDVTVSSANQSFVGTIRSVEQTANYQTKLYTVTVVVPADVSGLLAGMTADVVFHTDTAENTVVVPTEAILSSGDDRYVFVVEDNAAKRVDVTVGLAGSGITEITSGLEAGQQLVVVGQAYLKDGNPVRVVSAED